jgi:hypothetical protein
MAAIGLGGMAKHSLEDYEALALQLARAGASVIE